MLVRPVIVGTVGNRGAKPVRANPRAHQLVGCRFRRTVWARRLIWRAFGEFAWIVEREVAVHFVGADVVESHVILTGGFKQMERAFHVCCDEGFRIGDGIVIVRFGREMHDRVMTRHDTFQ